MRGRPNGIRKKETKLRDSVAYEFRAAKNDRRSDDVEFPGPPSSHALYQARVKQLWKQLSAIHGLKDETGKVPRSRLVLRACPKYLYIRPYRLKGHAFYHWRQLFKKFFFSISGTMLTDSEIKYRVYGSEPNKHFISFYIAEGLHDPEKVPPQTYPDMVRAYFIWVKSWRKDSPAVTDDEVNEFIELQRLTPLFWMNVQRLMRQMYEENQRKKASDGKPRKTEHDIIQELLSMGQPVPYQIDRATGLYHYTTHYTYDNYR